MAVEIDVQMKTFAVAAGVDLELRRFGYDELDVVVAALAQLVSDLTGLMGADGKRG